MPDEHAPTTTVRQMTGTVVELTLRKDHVTLIVHLEDARADAPAPTRCDFSFWRTELPQQYEALARGCRGCWSSYLGASADVLIAGALPAYAGENIHAVLVSVAGCRIIPRDL